MARMVGRRPRTAARRRGRRGFQEGFLAPFRNPAVVRAVSSGSATETCRAGSVLMGKVYLVGAGPGDPELLTVKAARLLARAGIVFHDSLVSREILQLIARDAEVIDVGKRCGRKLLTQDEINSLLVSAAANHEVVIRLKGGDPLIFGRAGEEIEALRNAAVDFEGVPGITAALGAAAVAGVVVGARRAWLRG